VHVLSVVAGRAALVALMLCLLPKPSFSQDSALGQPDRVAAAEWAIVDRVLGRPGAMQAGEVQKYSFPRSDLRVIAGGVEVRPALALGSWIAFKQMGGHLKETMAMGDLVLLESEVAPVIRKLQTMGVKQTALHNHLQHESPSVMYLHIEAHGDRGKIAEAVRAALALTKTPLTPPGKAAAGGAFGLDTARVASALGYAGKVNGGVYQVNVPRAEPVRLEGMEVPPAMGVATVLNFQPTGGGKAAITGDFVLTADEVNPVIKSLGDGVSMTALHSHMLREEPRLFFMHFWANDDALKLARTLQAALGETKVKEAGT
jgi:uncharacterized protein DUF1259